MTNPKPGRRPAPPLDEAKILANFLRPDGSLRVVPRQLQRKRLVYAYLVGRLPRDRVYAEREINDWLRPYHPDVATLRRDLVDLGFLDRHADGSGYWHAPADRADR